MKRSVIWTVFVSGLLLLASACAPAANETPIPPVLLESPDAAAPSSIKASAEVVPAQEYRLSFAISGMLAEVNVQAGDIVTAGQVLASLYTPDLEYAILQAQEAVKSAEAENLFWYDRTDRPPERRQIALDELEYAKRALETAQAELTQNTMLAPAAATVISVESLPGEFVQPGQVVITLAGLDKLQVETTDLSELNVAAVEIGQPAMVFVEALGENYPGKVTAISPISNTLGGDVVFKVTIGLDEQSSALLWGMSADVEIDV